MEFKNVTFIKIVGEQSGESARGPWSKLTFLCEERDVRFPKKIAFDTMNEEFMKTVRRIPEGAIVDVHFDVNSREHEGRWFHNVDAYKIVGISAPPAPGYAPPTTAATAPAASSPAPATTAAPAASGDKFPWEQ